VSLPENLLFGLLLGFSLVIPPGPMNAWIAASAARSLRNGVLVGLGAMSADGVLGTAVFLLDRTVDLHAVVRFVYLVGAAVMAYLAWRLYRRPPTPAAVPDRRAVFAQALGLGLSNPFQITWWLTAGVAFAYLGGWVLLLGLFAAIAVWIVVFPWAVRAGAQRHPWLERGIVIVSGALLLGFAAYFAALFVLG
jgi:threonine/homoserine/homoserine lactone efflux protein